MNDENDDISHLDSALVARLHPPMYNIHKYWARKPDNIVAAYIERYSKEGDTVLDPFSGSGVTAIEALRLGRKAIAVDLDPVGNF
ncbi:MAG: DNA methyltransferase, partial [Methanoregula sp.]